MARTFPNITEFNVPGASGKNRLYNILKAYSQYDMAVKYCQGLNYVAAMLLFYIDKEELAFFTLVHIMYNYNWRLLYIENMPKLNPLIKDLSTQIEKHIPDVFEHLKKMDIDMIGLFSHIFLTAFIYRTPFLLAVRIFDLFMFEREKSLITVTVNMLRLMKQKVLLYDSIVF